MCSFESTTVLEHEHNKIINATAHFSSKLGHNFPWSENKEIYIENTFYRNFILYFL